MGEMPEYPSQEAWDRAAKLGETLVRRHVGGAAVRRLKRGAHSADTIALVMGALVATGQALAAASNPDAVGVMEEMAVAHVRGAIRGADKPINADGSEWSSGGA